jgi:hypothetical protein
MKTCIVRCILLLTLLSVPGFAYDYPAFLYGTSPSASDFQKLQFEEWIQSRVTSALVVFIPQKQFFVNAKLSFIKVNDHLPSHSISLSGIDTQIPVFKKSVASTAWLQRISTIQISVALNRDVPDEAIKGISDLVKYLVPFVPASKVKVDVVRISSPSISPIDWLKQTKNIFIAFLGAFILGVIFIRVRRSRFSKPSFFNQKDFQDEPESHATKTAKTEAPNTEEVTVFEVKQPLKKQTEHVVEFEQMQNNAPDSDLKIYTVRREFPEAKLLQIPSRLAELAFLNLNSYDKVGLIVGLGKKESYALLHLVTRSGSKLRSFLEVEVKNCLNDFERIRLHQQEKDIHAQKFVDHCAEILKARPELHVGLDREIEDWILGISHERNRNVS